MAKPTKQAPVKQGPLPRKVAPRRSPAPTPKGQALARSRGAAQAARRPKGGGIDPGRFVGEVGANFAKGVGVVANEVGKSLPSPLRAPQIQRAMQNAPEARRLLKKAGGR